jgi:hypothetical protein
METISFWLNYCLIETTMVQYPQKMAKSSWHLPTPNQSIGFSGTNDTSCLLPMVVEQVEPKIKRLKAINGEMIEKLIENVDAVVLFEKRGDEGVVMWQKVLLAVIRSDEYQYRAIIDTGSLLAGVSNKEAADFIVKQKEFCKVSIFL